MTRATTFLSTMLHSLIVAAALTACAHTDSMTLDDTRWRLAGWSISSHRAADTGITAAFANGSITGHSGVNTYGGAYTATSNGAFSAGSVQMTEMAGPETAMRAERIYMRLLGQTASYRTRGATLTLYGKGGNELLIFDAER